MNDYYYIPAKKPRVPKLITIFDILLLIFAVVSGYMLIPMDINAGVSGTSRERADGIELMINNITVETGYFDRLFQTGTRKTYVQKDEDYGTYLIYRGNKYESFDYEKQTRTAGGNSSRAGAPVGFVSSSGLLSDDGGEVYFDNFKGYYGRADVDVSELLRTDGEFDFDKATQLLSENNEKPISLLEAASIYHYLQNGTIVGYKDGVVWYVSKNGDDYQLIRDCVDKPMKVAANLGKYGQNVYVIENKYIMYVADGDLFLFYNEKENEKLDCGGEVLELNYSVDDNGKVRIYACTDSKLIRFDLTGEGVKYENLQTNDIKKPDGMYITKEWGKTLCWLQYGEDYSIYEN